MTTKLERKQIEELIEARRHVLSRDNSNLIACREDFFKRVRAILNISETK